MTSSKNVCMYMFECMCGAFRSKYLQYFRQISNGLIYTVDNENFNSSLDAPSFLKVDMELKHSQ